MTGIATVICLVLALSTAGVAGVRALRDLATTRIGVVLAGVTELAVGDKAPAFTLKDQDGKAVKLSGAKGKRVVVYFYPKADTPGCTQQSCNLRDAFPQLKKLKAEVVGISPDSVEKQLKFAEKYGLKFSLLADTDHAVSKAYGMLPSDVSGDPTARTPAQNATLRNVFVIGPDRKIKLVLVYPMTTGRNFDEVLRVIDSLQLTANHQVATPAQWKQGENVIITAAGGKKIQVSKEVRAIVSGLGLKEAKDLVDGAPKPVLEKVSKEDAEKAKAQLEEAGATVELK